MNREQKFKQLAGYAELCASGVTSAENQAQRLARELLPPMAKPLVWEIEDGTAPNHPANTNDICSKWIGDHWYRIRSFPSACPADNLLINCALCVGESANSLQWCTTIDEAKAWCEQRHQSRFLELVD